MKKMADIIKIPAFFETKNHIFIFFTLMFQANL